MPPNSRIEKENHRDQNDETMKFLHTADWQMGMKAESLGNKAAERVRQARLNAAQRVIQVAKENDAEMILFAGDMFEDNAVDRSLVRQTGEILKSFGKPVFIIPGNHDPLAPGSVWEHSVWKENKNLHVIQTAEAIERENCILFPCLIKEKHSTKNPMAWISTRQESDKICIALAHGTVESIPDVKDFPIPVDAPSRYNLDYVALGHWHSYQTYADKDGAERMAYCGAHETTKFGERESGKVVLVKIAKRGATPILKPISTGNLDWQTWKETIRQQGELESLAKKLDAVSKPSSTLLRIQLEGILFPEDQVHLTAIKEKLETRKLLYGSLDADERTPSPDNHEWNEWIETLTPVFQCAAEKLQEQAAQDPDVQELSEAKQALLLLFELHKNTDA